MKKPLDPGTLVGSYRILRTLSDTGGFSVTYLAEKVGQPGVLYTLKELYPGDLCVREEDGSLHVLPGKEADFNDDLNAFYNEGERLISLGVDHPNIVHAFEMVHSHGTAYLVLEYIPGEQLHTFVDRHNPPDPDLIMEIMARLCGALIYLHRRHALCHFDIKPNNVIVRLTDNSPVLIDFGTARHYDAANSQTLREIQNGHTKCYAAPELVNGTVSGRELPDAIRMDVFGLGATLFRLLTRKNPPAVPLDDLIEDKLHGLPPEYSTLVDLVCRAMRVKPEERLPDVDAVARLLGFDVGYETEENELKTVRVTQNVEIPTMRRPQSERSIDSNSSPAEDPEKTPERRVPSVNENSYIKSEVPPRGLPEPFPTRRSFGKTVLILVMLLVVAGLSVFIGKKIGDLSGPSAPLSVPMVAQQAQAFAPANETALEPMLPALVEDTLSQIIPAEIEDIPDDVSVSGNSTTSYEFPNGSIWYGPLHNGKPDGVGELCVFSHTEIGDSTLYAGWIIRNAVFEDGFFISGDIYDAYDEFQYTYIP